MSIAPPIGRDVSSDEVGLVDDAVGLAGADADEDAFVQPVERGCRGLVSAGTSTSNSTRNSMLSSPFFATPSNGVSTPHLATGVETPISYAATLTAFAMTASRMTPATMSGCDSIRKCE